MLNGIFRAPKFHHFDQNKLNKLEFLCWILLKINQSRLIVNQLPIELFFEPIVNKHKMNQIYNDRKFKEDLDYLLSKTNKVILGYSICSDQKGESLVPQLDRVQSFQY
jgi:hypothetical protein